MSRLPSVIWDMDGVLLDSEPIYFKVENEIISKYGKDVRTILSKLLGRTASACAKITVEELNLPITPEVYLAQRNKVLLEEMKSVEILPGVEAIVRHLKSIGVRCAIATSSPRDLLIAKQHGKDEFFSLFDAVVCGDDVNNGKPDPEIFLKAAQAIQADPANCIVFEDAPAGLRAATLAGMRTVALPNPDVDVQLYKDEHPTVIVPTASLLDFDIATLGFPPLVTAKQ